MRGTKPIPQFSKWWPKTRRAKVNVALRWVFPAIEVVVEVGACTVVITVGGAHFRVETMAVRGRTPELDGGRAQRRWRRVEGERNSEGGERKGERNDDFYQNSKNHFSLNTQKFHCSPKIVELQFRQFLSQRIRLDAG